MKLKKNLDKSENELSDLKVMARSIQIEIGIICKENVLIPPSISPEENKPQNSNKPQNPKPDELNPSPTVPKSQSNNSPRNNGQQSSRPRTPTNSERKVNSERQNQLPINSTIRNYPNSRKQIVTSNPRIVRGNPSSQQSNLKRIFIGIWGTKIEENKYQMKVTYNSVANQYEGVLIKQGKASQNVGFSIGELVWKATLSTNSNGEMVLLEQQKFRFGSNGISTSYEWRQGSIDLGNSNVNKLVTSTGVLYRVNVFYRLN